MNLQTERIESLKAGVIGALAFAIADLILTGLNSSILAQQFEVLSQLQRSSNEQIVLQEAIAWVSGFLFGVTYRYIIRDDRNPHLKDGAVLAFGTVRGLALLEVSETLTSNFWSVNILGVESILCFAIARFTLDLAMGKNWLKPFL